MEKFPCLIFDLRGKSQVSEYFLGLLADNAVQSFPIVTSTNTEPSAEAVIHIQSIQISNHTVACQ
jgi:hypothetical protein